MNYSDDQSFYSFPRYLAAKKSVDDRALNHHVWRSLAASLPGCSIQQPLRVLEIGAGIGTMIERLLEWDVLQYAEYTALDAQAENMLYARGRLPAWAEMNGYSVSRLGKEELNLRRPDRSAWISLHTADLFEFIDANQQAAEPRQWDLLIAHAFLDLIDIPAALPRLFELLQPGGLFYFTINFDGATLFEPALDPSYDALIEALYHRTMDERITDSQPSGDSRAGRHLFHHIQTAGGDVLDVGASDWVVHPIQGEYPYDEAYFLHFIIHTLHQALNGHPELDARCFESWITRRHAQIENAELVYIAHQLDYLGRVAP